MEKPEQKINPRLLHDYFVCDYATGELRWKETRSPKVRGKLAGYVNEHGYRTVRLNGSLIRGHRIIWAMWHGEWPEKQVDHIDGDTSNNAIGNLRACDKSTNGMNRLRPANNKSGYKGVHWSKEKKKWAAQITTNGKTKSLGYFKTAQEAGEQYAIEAKIQHGQYANHELINN